MITQSLKIQSMCILKAQNEPRVIGVSLATDCPLSCPQDVRYFWRALKWCVPHTWIAPHTQPSTTCHLTTSCSQKTEIRRAFSNPNLSLWVFSPDLWVWRHTALKRHSETSSHPLYHTSFAFCFYDQLIWPMGPRASGWNQPPHRQAIVQRQILLCHHYSPHILLSVGRNVGPVVWLLIKNTSLYLRDWETSSVSIYVTHLWLQEKTIFFRVISFVPWHGS